MCIRDRPALLVLAAALYTLLAGYSLWTGTAGLAGSAGRWTLLAVLTFAWLMPLRVWWERRSRVSGLLAAAVTLRFLSVLTLLSSGAALRDSFQHLPSLLLSTLASLLLGAATALGLRWLRRQRGLDPLAVLDTLMVAALLLIGVWVAGLDTLVTQVAAPTLAVLALLHLTAGLLTVCLLVMLLLRGLRQGATPLLTAGWLCWLLAGAVQGSAQQLGVTAGTIVVFGLLLLRQARTSQANLRMQQQLEAQRRELEHLAYHDKLTGLPNRTALTHYFEREVGEQDAFGIFSLDLNGFKTINDTHGHAVGDLILQHAAQQLLRAVAEPGRIFRWGGDEFVIVVPGVQRGADAEALARFIAVNIRTPMPYRGEQLSVGTSVGYALGRGNRDYAALLVLADHEMYTVKQRTGSRR